MSEPDGICFGRKANAMEFDTMDAFMSLTRTKLIDLVGAESCRRRRKDSTRRAGGPLVRADSPNSCVLTYGMFTVTIVFPPLAVQMVFMLEHWDQAVANVDCSSISRRNHAIPPQVLALLAPPPATTRSPRIPPSPFPSELRRQFNVLVQEAEEIKNNFKLLLDILRFNWYSIQFSTH